MKLLFIGNWIADDTLQALGWTLFHSLWIGLLAAVASGIIIISTRRSTARLRYNLLIGIMFLFLLSCGFVFFTQIESSKVTGVELKESTINTAVSDLSSDEQGIIIQASLINEFTQFFNANAHIVVFIWLIFFVTHCVKLLTGLGGIQRLKNHRTSFPPGEWITKLNELSNKLGIHQTVTLLQSELIKVPIAIGFFKPAILVPMSLLSNLRPEQVEAILLHELAHIRRRDYLVNLLQRFAEAIFFFNPCFIWLCSLIRQEREACCDDIVVATTGQKRNYLEALVSFQEFSVTSPEYAMAIKNKQHYLLNRVKRLLTRENKKLNTMEKILLLFGLIVFTAFTIIPQKEENEKKPITDAVMVDQPIGSKIQTIELAKPPVKKIRDTVPSKDKGNESDFKQISTNVNIEGNIKKETITAIDPGGKKYTIIKLNDKLTSLQVDDKMIPENEVDNYTSVINQIEQAREKNRERKMKDIEARNAANEKKKIEQQDKIKAKDKKDVKGKDSNEEKVVIGKMIETKRKELDADRKILDQKRKELSNVKKDIIVKKQELKSKEGKEKEAELKKIKSKEKIMDSKLKEIENRKKVIEDKKQKIGNDKEKLEKIKENENKAKEKGEGEVAGRVAGKLAGKVAGRGAGKEAGKGEERQHNNKKLFKENKIAFKQEARDSVSTNIFKRNPDHQKTEVYKNVPNEPTVRSAPKASGWQTEPSESLFKKEETKITTEKTKPQRAEVPRKQQE